MRSNIKYSQSVSSTEETPRSSSKIQLCCALHFQLSSQSFIWWWNTMSYAWYTTWNQSACLRRQRDRTVRLQTVSRICSRQAQVQMDVTAHLWHYHHIPFKFYSVFFLFLILVSFTIHKLTNNTDQRNYIHPVLWYIFQAVLVSKRGGCRSQAVKTYLK